MFGIADRNRRFPLEECDINLILTYQHVDTDQGLLCIFRSRFDCDPMTLTLIY